MLAYYNENDPKTAAWLRELIKVGEIAPGFVDERDIREITPNEIRGYRQYHFFAGIGVWSYALRLAGWPDEKPVWTGSCPCQPFSAAGKRGGASDERHLWPAFHWLIRQLKPNVIFGEQVASKDGVAWLDIVSNDLESEGYAVAPLVLPACGVGAPHKRERSWFVAESQSQQPYGNGNEGNGRRELANDRGNGALADSASLGYDGRRTSETLSVGALEPQRLCHAGALVDAASAGLFSSAPAGLHCGEKSARSWNGELERPSPVNGYWRNAEWLECSDGKARPVEPGSFPLAHGVTGRVGLLRGFGNAIVPQVAAEMISAYMEIKRAYEQERATK